MTIAFLLPFDVTRINSSFAPGARLANRTERERSRLVLFCLENIEDHSQIAKKRKKGFSINSQTLQISRI